MISGSERILTTGFPSSWAARLARHALLATVIALGAALTMPLRAQPAPAPAAAGDIGVTSQLEEVIITAQRRRERLQDLPVSASVLSGAALEGINATDISDLNRLVPSVEFKGTYNGRVPIAMRGMSTNAGESVIGLTSGVSIEVDGVPVSSDSFSANALEDVQQVEVLKGPQATLGGRTASAGVINFVTAAPTDRFQGAFNATVTGDNEQRASLRLSGPISSGLSYSLAASDHHLQYLAYNDLLDRHAESDDVGVRAKLAFTVDDSLDGTLMGRYSRFTSTEANLLPQYLTPGAALFPFFPSAFDASGSPTAFGIPQATAYPGINIRYGNTHYASPVHMHARNYDHDTSLTLNYHIGEYTITSVTAFQREAQQAVQDIFLDAVYFFDLLAADNGVAAPHFDDTQRFTQIVEQTTEELRIVSPIDGPLSFIAGAYYSSNPVALDFLRPLPTQGGALHAVSGAKTYDLYARATVRVADHASVVAGLRYNRDQLEWQQTQYFNPDAGQYQGCTTAFAFFGPPSCTWVLSDGASALVGDLSLQRSWGGDSMAYLTIARGYKPRAFNTDHAFVSTQDAPLPSDQAVARPTDQERINHVELGLKTSLLDRHATLNMSAFNTVYGGYQVETVDASVPPVGIVKLGNGRALTRGLELEFDWKPDALTHLSAEAAYIDALITEFPNASCYTTQTAAQGCINGVQDLSGHALPDSPKFKFNASLERRLPLQRLDLLLGGTLAYRTSAVFQADGNPETGQPGFALLNLSFGVQSKSGRTSLTAFVNNVSNHFYLVDSEDFFSGVVGFSPSGPPANFVVGQPARDAHRYVGARLELKL
jgi:iron complex outermembrane recepter protein